ncbi:hypothetical protein [Flaviaesturariibacter aridisoli]|uniref:hypothetical protein n=1 Tax=Flaviaesturariibacter aridisoli TaxID=2545761 RepID=UPI0014051A69|nr:hypothetical protein [Flaviaesturariibacter aridisoli]
MITLQFPNFSAMKSMVERSSLLVCSFDILNYTITGKFPPELVNQAISQLGASHFRKN